MNNRHAWPLVVLGLAVWLPGGVWPADVLPKIVSDENAFQKGTRIHEAYAQSTGQVPREGIIVPKQPPEPIKEIAPSEKPEGKNVQWIGGYWDWDTDKNDFTWVSGVYRDVPPGRKWMAPTWVKVVGGWQRISGYWSPANGQENQYLPAPPQSLENGPVIPQPNPDSFYIPGQWMYLEDQYSWRPGFWTNSYPGWTWINPRYLWTPRGYLFVSGFWDRPFERRGSRFERARIDEFRGSRFGPSRIDPPSGPRVVIQRSGTTWSGGTSPTWTGKGPVIRYYSPPANGSSSWKPSSTTTTYSRQGPSTNWSQSGRNSNTGRSGSGSGNGGGGGTGRSNGGSGHSHKHK